MRKLLLALIVLAFRTAAPCFAAGALNYSPSPGIYDVTPGETVDLLATLQNVGDAPLNLNDLSITFNGPAVSYFSRNPLFNFFDSLPGIFETADPPFVGNLSEILVAPSTPSGTYTVTVELIGGANPSLIDPNMNGIGTQTFTLVVGPSSGASPAITTASPLPSGTVGAPYSETLSAMGGTGLYSNWIVTAGDMPPGLSLNSTTGIVGGTPLAISGVFNFSISFNDTAGASGSGTIQLTVNSPTLMNSLVRVGGFAQVASGGGWTTTLTLINPSAVAANARINFYAGNGDPLILSLRFPQFGLSSSTSSQSVTLSPNESIVIESSAESSLSVGWADIQASGALAGYSIFRSSLPGMANSEGTALATPVSSSLVLPYDNTNGYRTGLAVANQSSSPAAITAILLDQNGAQLASSQISLPALGQTSFFLDDLVSISRNQLGVIQLQSSAAITGVGLRFSRSGSFTSIPVIP